jgi:phosphodiesterase/alkaline phosphatase D-like protein
MYVAVARVSVVGRVGAIGGRLGTPMPSLSRRRLLTLSITALPALAFGCGSAFDPDSVPESIERFPRTPIAGDMTSTRVVLTFHVADDAPVTLRVWTGDDIAVDEAIAASGDGFHKVRVDELVPGTTYRYAVFSGDAPRFDGRSLIGQFRTAPADDAVVPVKIALLCCVGQGTVLPDFFIPDGELATKAPFQWEVFTHAGAFDLDALVHLGDQAYLDFVWSMAGGTLDAYLHAWGFYHGGGYRDIYPLAGLSATWDDHESTDNADFDPWDVTPEDAAKLANAKAAWYKVVPIDALTPDERPVWRGFRWGQTLELLLLDARYELTADHLMSEEQLAWLIERIGSSPCRFVCVATPRPFAKITTSQPLASDNGERWEAFPGDRDRLVAAVDAAAARVVFVTGDIHMNYLGRASITGEAPSDVAWEVCVTSGNVNPRAAGLSPDQFAFVNTAPHLPVLTFDPTADTVHVAFYGRDGALDFEQLL